MLFILKYFFIGAFLTLLGCITITVIMLILSSIDTRTLIYFGIFIIIAANVGFLTFRAFEKPDEYKFQISYDNVLYYTNDITLSGDAITFINNDGTRSTIERGYKITNLQ